MLKNLPAMQGPGFNTWDGKISWIREWLPTAIFLSGEFHGVSGLQSMQSQTESQTLLIN